MLRPSLLCLGVVALLAACSNLQTPAPDDTAQANASTASPTSNAAPAAPAQPTLPLGTPDGNGNMTINLRPRTR
ncbi:hypothetical protein [Ralstonia solanacearum]|uniref:hypothetical protein n=1 Tax=Ralstonia solanacearum TaxID=305 RepID=UPI003D2D751D